MNTFIKYFIDLILPPRCLLCGKVIQADDCLCGECFCNINFISKPYCIHCGAPLPNNNIEDMYCVSCLKHDSPFRFCRSAVKYDEFSKKLILDFKFSDFLENKYF